MTMIVDGFSFAAAADEFKAGFLAAKRGESLSEVRTSSHFGAGFAAFVNGENSVAAQNEWLTSVFDR